MLLKKEEVEKMTQIQGLIRFDDQQVASVAGVHVQTLIKAKNRSGKLSTNTINKIKEFITLYGEKALKTKVIEATPETVETSQEDMVNSPPHYSENEIECIDAMVAAFGLERVQDYAAITAFKYIWRENKKWNPAEDREKALWYMRFSTGDDPRLDNKV
jgi:hypothetical protein|tara:strand:+ start:387 stop:863 length:477 start_codon:yes stop_codon:yes gene_type:complete